MDAGIQKLKGLLSFGRDRSDHAQAQNLRALLEGMAAKSPPHVVHALTTGYLPVVAGISNLHLRFKLLENVLSELDRCLPLLERHVSEAPLPLDEKTAATALTADNFLKTLAWAYAGLVEAIKASKMDSVLGHLLQNAARRSMQFLLRRQILAYRAYASPSPSSWLHMHDLVGTTRALRLAQGSGHALSVEMTYAAALLLSYADPNKFRRDEVDGLVATVTRLAKHVNILDAAGVSESHGDLPSRFFVQTNEGHAGGPLARVARGTSRRGHLVVECQNVVRSLDRIIDVDPEDAAKVTDLPEFSLVALRTSLGGLATRRFHRQRFKAKAHLVFGLPELAALIEVPVPSRRQSDQPTPESTVPPISEWAIIDESPDGFRVRYHKGDQQHFHAGDVVGLQQKEHPGVHICLLRRVSSRGPGKLEIGLQEISPSGNVIRLPVALSPPLNQAIFLSKLPGHGGASGLISFPGALSGEFSNTPIEGPDGQKCRLSTCLESNELMEFHLLAALD